MSRDHVKISPSGSGNVPVWTCKRFNHWSIFTRVANLFPSLESRVKF